MKQFILTITIILLITSYCQSQCPGSTCKGDNVRLGKNAGKELRLGIANTLIGEDAGRLNTNGSRNVFVGQKAGSNSQGSFNVSIGDQSGIQNLGNENVFVGHKAGRGSTSGQFNTFVGTFAGSLHTTGVANTYIGRRAGMRNSQGSRNVFVGQDAGINNQGSFNVSIGDQSGIQSTGNENVFVGHKAGRGSTSGQFNTFVGTFAGNMHTIGIANTYIGRRAGMRNNQGSRNVFVGQDAGIGSLGSFNVSIGDQSGTRNTGNRNIFIGQGVGRNNVNGSGNIFLGFEAGFNEVGSNKLYIANSRTNAPLIYGDFEAQLLRVNGTLELSQRTLINNQAIFTPGGSSISLGNTGIQDANEDDDIAFNIVEDGEFEVRVGLKNAISIGGFNNSNDGIGIINMGRLGEFDVRMGGGLKIGRPLDPNNRARMLVQAEGNRNNLGHIESGNFGDIFGTSKWLSFGSAPVGQVYGQRLQWDRNFAVFNLRKVNDDLKDLVVQWGGTDANNRLLFEYTDNPSSPGVVLMQMEKDAVKVETNLQIQGRVKLNNIPLGNGNQLLLDEEGNIVVGNTNSITELSKENQSLKEELADMKTRLEKLESLLLANPTEFEERKVAKLLQNEPNPFNQTTKIRFNLPEFVQSATLLIYDMQGNQIKKLVLNQRGEGQVQIQTNGLSNGLYLYSLVADGKEVDIKRMMIKK